MMKVFDGHNDVLARMWLSNAPDPVAAFLETGLPGHLDLKRCQASPFAGGLFALFVPPFDYVQKHHPDKLKHTQQTAFDATEISDIIETQLSYIEQLASRSSGQIQICGDVPAIRNALEQNQLAVVIHMEGADVLDANFERLNYFYARGLRSLGPLWNTPNQFGHGLQANFPHSPDTGAGLTELGQALIQYCSERRILIDVSHMNEKAFWDTAKLSQLPLIATHSNAHQLCPQARNLTDHQLNAIKTSRGCVGVNFDTAFLRSDGQRNKATSLDIILDHIEYLMQHLGEDHVALGSDFDGGFISDQLQDVRGLAALQQAFETRGYSKELQHKLCLDNWLNALDRVWHGGNSQLKSTQ